MAGLLSKERTIAKPGFNRWLIPPCALATHLCIGQAYALSVFNLPLTQQLGISKSIAGDWRLTELGWIFTIAIFVLGASAALFGKWVQAVGPRKSGSRRRALLGRRAFSSARSGSDAPAVAGLSRLRRDRRMRPRHRLHHAGVDADLVVSRSARHVDRHGDHGIRRRRADRLAAVGLPDAALRVGRPRRASSRPGWCWASSTWCS